MGCQASKVRDAPEVAKPAAPAKAAAKAVVAVPAAPKAVVAAAPSPIAESQPAVEVITAPVQDAAVDEVVAAPVEEVAVVEESAVSEPIAEIAVPQAEEVVIHATEVAVAVAASVEEIPAQAEEAVTVVADAPAAIVAEEPTAAVAEEDVTAPSALGTSATANIRRRVAFDKETMRRTAPVTAVPLPTTTKLTKKQQSMIQSGHKSTGRRGPVASKHSRCKAQMQDDVYLEMASAFERLLTNVNTIDAHLDSR